MGTLPTGTVTFLFTDIEGSTRLAQQYPESIAHLLERHHAILKSSIEAHSGYIFHIIGDAFCAAFQAAREALDAAVDAQRCLVAEPWSPEPVRVRMGIATGIAQLKLSDDRPPDYSGYLNLARVQRLMSVAYGGQILLANASADLVRGELPANVSLRDLGEHRLKSLLNPERLWQVTAPGLPSDFPPLKSLNAIPNNLPLQLTSFIGREREIAEIKNLLKSHRLVTLTGAGGTGKSRLAGQVAADVLDQFHNGVWFVELAPITDPSLIPQTVIRILGLTAEPGREPLDILKDYLADKSLLLILDNCEHLLDDSCRFADAILRAAPQVKIMPTSREALNLAGEQAYRVPSLSAPDINDLPPIGQLTQYEAVYLFIERASLVSPKFSVTTDNAPAVAQICHRLDGIPLAIELAAARVKSMPLDAIVSRLDDRFRLLTGGSRTALPRQQTLRALIDWSYNLLSEPERLLLQRLSVFRGGCTLEAAEVVCAGEGIEPLDVADLLSKLVDKSLVSLDEHARYRMLETIRQYAAERLIDSSQAEWARDQHLKYMVDLAEKAEPEIRGPNQIVWLDCLEAEVDNVRAAIAWAQGRDPELFLRLSSALWQSAGRIQIGDPQKVEWLMSALDMAQGAPLQLRARAAARLSYEHWSEEFMDRFGRKAGALAAQVGDKFSQALALGAVAMGERFRDPRSAVLAAQKALALSEEIHDHWVPVRALITLGFEARYRNDLAASRSFHDRALQEARLAGDGFQIAFALRQCAGLAMVEGDYPRAEKLLDEAWATALETRDRSFLPSIRTFMAQCAMAGENYARAEQLLAEASELPAASGNSVELAFILESWAFLDLAVGDIQKALGHGRAALEWSQKGVDVDTNFWALFEIAEIYRIQGDLDAAHTGLKKALSFCCDQRYREGYCECLQSFGALALARGNAERAARLFAARAKLRQTVYDEEFYPFRVREREQQIADARAQLGEDAFNKAWAAGQAMTGEEMLNYAFESPVPSKQ